MDMLQRRQRLDGVVDFPVRTVVDVAVGLDYHQQGALVGGAGRVVGRDLVLQDTRGFVVAGLHGGVGFGVDVTPGEVDAFQGGRRERK